MRESARIRRCPVAHVCGLPRYARSGWWAGVPQRKAPVKSGFVVVAGRPNVGKSTLVNALCGEKVAITSTVPNTTRRRLFGVAHGARLPARARRPPGLPTSDRPAHRAHAADGRRVLRRRRRRPPRRRRARTHRRRRPLRRAPRVRPRQTGRHRAQQGRPAEAGAHRLADEGGRRASATSTPSIR